MPETSIRVFAHVDAPLSGLYRRVMRVFVASKRRFVVHLRPEDVVDALRADGAAMSPEAVEKALGSLEEWGNLRADPDTSRVFRTTSAPLVCTEGVPSTACHRLLAASAGAGARLRWRSDFDWSGLRTTAAALSAYGARPWRMSVGDYAAALDGGDSEPLRGPVADSPWDPELAARMRTTGRAVMEERLIPHLLGDLTTALPQR